MRRTTEATTGAVRPSESHQPRDTDQKAEESIMNTAPINPAQTRNSRLPTLSLLVATAAVGLATISLAVAANAEVTTNVPEVVPAERVVGHAPATAGPVELDRNDARPSTDRSPAAPNRRRGDGCYVSPTGAILC
jgi:hypothetical protein